MAQPVIIHSDFPGQRESELLKQICGARSSRHVYVKMFKRYGFSGSKLLLVFFFSTQKGVPYLIKIGRLNDINKEYEAVKSMKNLVSDCNLEEDRIFQYDDVGALIYKHRGTDNPENADTTLTLSNVMYKKKQITGLAFDKIIKSVYGTMRQAHTYYRYKNINVFTHYKRYFRGNESKKLLEKAFGLNRSEGLFEYLGEEIYNPLRYYDEMPKRIDVPVGRVHGDLHPDNIVIKNNNVSLIDFAWSLESRDILVDYVLFENSIRFMYFPKVFCLEEHDYVNNALLSENGYDLILRKSFINSENQFYYHRMAGLIASIRSNAKSVLKDEFDFKSYLFVQFLVLYGLYKYDTYNQVIVAKVLGRLAKKLRFDYELYEKK